MIDFDSDLGRRAKERIDRELCVWLTTTDSDGTPQPRPVWFVWDDGEFVIHSQPGAAKMKHIEANPQVAVHFDGGFEGEDVQVFTGRARRVETDFGTPVGVEYFRKYGEYLPPLGLTEDSFKREYSATIRIRPEKLR